MRKSLKIAAAVISAVLAFSAFLTPVFGNSEAQPKEIKNDSFFIKIPVGYDMMYSPFYDFVRVGCDEEVRDGRIAVIVQKNSENADINALPKAKYNDFANSVLKSLADELQIVEGSAEAKYAEVNKSAALCCRVRTSELSRYAYFYIFTAVNKIYFLYFDTDINENKDEVLFTLNSFCLNDERFPCDAEAPQADFSAALPYEQALLNDYSRYSNPYVYSLEYEGGEPLGFMLAGLAIDILPFIVVTVIDIVLIVKYVKRKRKIRFKSIFYDLPD